MNDQAGSPSIDTSGDTGVWLVPEIVSSSAASSEGGWYRGRPIIVTENDSSGSWTSDNSISFLGNVTANGLAALPDGRITQLGRLPARSGHEGPPAGHPLQQALPELHAADPLQRHGTDHACLL